MALIKTAAKSTPKFEDEIVRPAVGAAVLEAMEAEDAAPVAAKLPVVAASTSVGASGKKFASISKNLKNAIEPMPFGALPTLKAKAGDIMDETGTSAGRFIDVQVMSYNYKWIVTPGEEGNEAAKLLRASYDGVTLEVDGSSVQDYLQQLKTDGYDGARVTRRVDVIGILLAAEKKAYDKVGMMVLMDLAPTSVGRFDGQLMQASVSLLKGTITEEEATKMRFKTVAKSGGGNNWSAIDTGFVDQA